MKNLQYSNTQLFEAFIKSTQYLVRLKTQQDVWDHLGKFIMTYFPADWTALVQRDPIGGVSVRHCTLPDETAARLIRTDEMKTLITDVLDSGFFASQTIRTPSPSMTVFLPIAEEHKVILIGHRTGEPLPKELLNVYLAIAGLAGTTFERLRAEEALRLAGKYNRSLLEASLDPLVTIGPDGKITDVNAATEIVTGYSRDRLIGTNFSDYFTDSEKAEAGYQRVFREGTVRDYPLEVKHQDGHITPVLYNASVYRDETGKVIGVFAAARDITNTKRAEDEIKKLNEDLEMRILERTADLTAVNEEMEAFTYSVSHDLRAPLRHIHGFVDILNQNSAQKLDDKGRRYFKNISNAASQMGHLVDDLLSFSRMGRAEIKKSPINLENLVNGVIDEMKGDLGERDIEWKIGELATVYGDPSMLRLVMVNLISNAVKFTRKRDKTVIEIGSYTIASGENVVYVKDNGVGFDMRYVDKLFGVFQRLHSTEEFEGTGIGLANIRRIISRHGGRTWAESAIGEGASFYFSLPPKNR